MLNCVEENETERHTHVPWHALFISVSVLFQKKVIEIVM